MSDEVLDVEVTESVAFTPDLPTSLLGWCNDGLHMQCPAVLDPMVHQDPARKGSTYTLPARACSCACHTRPVL